jgi:hypothetical protein
MFVTAGVWIVAQRRCLPVGESDLAIVKNPGNEEGAEKCEGESAHYSVGFAHVLGLGVYRSRFLG